MVDEYGVIEFEWDIDPSDSALLVIDMQSGFLDPDGTFGKAGLNKNQRAIIPSVAKLVDTCREAGMPIISSGRFRSTSAATRLKESIRFPLTWKSGTSLSLPGGRMS
jgi:nicotinamidase-related amidase